jgi:hypothetical protein
MRIVGRLVTLTGSSEARSLPIFPFQLPIKFELILNLKSTKALGLDVPWFLQQRADEVIE